MTVAAPKFKKKRYPVFLRVEAGIREKINEAAKKAGVSTNTFLRQLVDKELTQ